MELSSNSNTSKHEISKKTEKVIAGTVTRREKGLFRKFTETFVGGDPKTVVQGVIMDVVIPAARDLVVDAMNQAVERVFYGDSRGRLGRSSGRSSGAGGVISYNRFFNNVQKNEPRANNANRSARDLNDIVVPNRAEAEAVIDRMFDITNRYDQATVADLHDALGITIEPIDNKWGWTSMEGSNCKRVAEGYLLILPDTHPIKS